MKTKICTHCGSYTHPQPQDYNHDKGYGHCYNCLDTFYIKHSYPLKDKLINVYHELDHGILSEDDSHAKVIEIIKDGIILRHVTVYFKIDMWQLDAITF